MSGPTVVGVGNDWRGDDAAGLLVARSLRATLSDVRVLELDGDPGMVLDAWAGAQEAIVIDAVQSGRSARHDPPAGRRRRPVAGRTPVRIHATLGIAEAVELARALGRLPARLELDGIEVGGFETGEGLTPAVARAVDALCGELRERLASAPRPT